MITSPAVDDSMAVALALRNAGVATWSWHVESRTLTLDERSGSLTGCRSGAELLAQLPRRHARLLIASLVACGRHDVPLSMQVLSMGVDGRRSWLDIRGGRAGAGRDSYVYGAFWDITVSKQRELKLRAENARSSRAERRKDACISQLGHELRTPLSAIVGYADRVSDALDDAVVLGDVDQIRRDSRFILRLVEDMLEASRTAGGRVSFAVAPVNLSRLVADVQGDTAIRAKARGIAFDVTVAEGLPSSIVTEAVRMRQILQNLLDNAVKFTDSGQVALVVGSMQQDGGVSIVFDVIDSGPGIAERDRDRIFEPFVQLHRDTGRRGGMGIGLALARRLAVGLGGSLELLDTSAKGSRFRFCIPVRPTGAGARVVAAPRSGAMGTTPRHPVREPTVSNLGATPGSVGRRVLLVEDHCALAQLTKRQLEACGYEVRVAESGTDALRQAAHWPPAAAIMDVNLPDGSGLTLISALRKLDRLQTCRFVAYSGSSDPNDRQAAIRAGFDAYFIKPTDTAELVAAISPDEPSVA